MYVHQPHYEVVIPGFVWNFHRKFQCNLSYMLVITSNTLIMRVKTFYAKIMEDLAIQWANVFIFKRILRKARTQPKNNQLQKQKIHKENGKQFHSTKVRSKVQEAIRKAPIIQRRITVAQVSRLNFSMLIRVSTWTLKFCNINLKIQQNS